LSQILKVSLRAVAAGGSPLYWADGAPAISDQFPLRQAALAPQWRAGELIQDDYLLRLPDLEAAASPRLQVILYAAEDGTELGRWEIDLSTFRL
jgi:hypothetical protein